MDFFVSHSILNVWHVIIFNRRDIKAQKLLQQTSLLKEI